MAAKKVLIVSYYWPPAGGISVLRSLKIAKYLLQFGWEPVIYTVEDAQYPIIDEDNLKHVPEGITILKKKALEPFDFYKKLTKRKKKDTLANVLNANDGNGGLLHKLSVWVRANFFIPDARALWVKPSVKYLTKYLKENPVDAIFSDGPPHTNTLIACRISKATNTPWLMDWQDPWTQVDYYKLFPITKWADKRHHKLEKECIDQASVITTVSPSWKIDLEKIGGKNVHVIPWGYDEADFRDFNTELSLDDYFSITHIGLLGEDRIPFNLIDVLSEMCNDNAQFKKDLKLELFGTVDFNLIDYAVKKGLKSCLVIKSQVPRKEALAKISSSQLLLLLLNKADNAKGRIPGKLFEYLYVKRPILTFGVGESDVENILKETQSGVYSSYDEKVKLKAEILSFYLLFEQKTNLLKPNNIDQYDMKVLVKKISEFLGDFSS
jgi:glycosyltransferase involved in cell wall biosynthesis